eukprot:TRINITY_DN7739_c0_g1_i1.p1 TRINITY_DN7739_c0_g1~~TRINITY_DN7739_c0_g1_i1.p1  ORF type:complete len:165 (+),score=12.65 TRINITY_DN7739_c0_g1_i1:68-562(+)
MCQFVFFEHFFSLDYAMGWFSCFRATDTTIIQNYSETQIPSASRIARNNAKVPRCDLKKIGWQGNISREESEVLLLSGTMGQYLVRYSERSKSFVFSYSKPDRTIVHLAWIFQDKDGKVMVECQGGANKEFQSLEHYVNSQMESLTFLTGPVAPPEPVYHNEKI